MNALSFVKNTLQGFVDHKQSFSEEEAVSWLVCNARSNKNPTTKKIGTGKTRFGHGQLPASIRYLARIFSWAFGKVRAFIRKLKKLGVITVHYKWCLPIITVNDYDNVVNDAAELKINPKLMAKKDRIADLPDRRQRFYNELVPYVQKYGKEMVRKFYNYWSESDDRGFMKWELRETWELPARLQNWHEMQNERAQNRQSGNTTSLTAKERGDIEWQNTKRKLAERFGGSLGIAPADFFSPAK